MSFQPFCCHAITLDFRNECTAWAKLLQTHAHLLWLPGPRLQPTWSCLQSLWKDRKLFWWWTSHHLKESLGHDNHELPYPSQISLEGSSVGALMNVKKLFVGHISIFLHPYPWKTNICYLYTWWNMFCSVHRPFVTPLLLFSHVKLSSGFTFGHRNPGTTLWWFKKHQVRHPH